MSGGHRTIIGVGSLLVGLGLCTQVIRPGGDALTC